MQVDRWGLGWDNGNGNERYRHKSGLTKRYKDIEVDIQKIKRDSGGSKKDKNWCKWIDDN